MPSPPQPAVPSFSHSAPAFGAASPPPAPPPVAATAAASQGVEAAPGQVRHREFPKGPLSAAEQYDKLKDFLPLTKEPDTPRPSPDELIPGVRLRVEWSDGWWAARVVETRPNAVRVSFDTWSEQYDEWISHESQRLRMARPEDKDLKDEADSPAPWTPPPLQDLSNRSKSFVPKPYNPEKEFQKRQLRLREKIADMQQAKFGEVDPALQALRNHPPSTQVPAMPAAAPGPASQFPPPPAAPTAGVAAPQATAPPQATVPAPAAAPPPPGGFPPPPAAGAPTSQSTRSAKIAEDESPPVDPDELLSQASSPPWSAASEPEPVPVAKSTQRSAASQAPSPPAAPKQAAVKGNLVRWEELLTDEKERYYLEVATGRTTWELPHEGWTALLDDDGSKYYWDPVVGTTQWNHPGEPENSSN
eukprot:TRINITY_DN22592_c0_g2_i1.p1 TRINITY_DN22592_c0_g2~~TRINITY_DN22592_c0_g2_i1.p1  ORF type:complete len:417 (+),score=73.10 TRINITY_DN22592_c0_g2_i1:497-1747(+)